MEMKLRKLLPLAGAFCTLAFASAFANSGSNCPQKPSQCEPYTPPAAPESCEPKCSNVPMGTYKRGTFREITPNAGPRVCHGADVFITANFIWWKAVQDGLRYASSGVGGNTTAAAPFASVGSGTNKSVGEDWAPGFKVGLGLALSHDGWDLYAQYTWLHAYDSSSINTTLSGGLAANYAGNSGQTNNSPFINADSAKAKWNLRFNVIDFEIGRNFYLSQYLTMRPFAGLKGTWQDQDIRFRYNSGSFTIPGVPTNATGPYRVHNHVDTWGIGIRGGFNLGWYLAKEWSIQTNFAWTTMWANYDDLKRNDTLDDRATGNSSRRANINNNSWYTVKYIGEMEIALRWETWFYDDNYHFAIQAGWENQVWINWGQVPVVYQQQTEHDLTLHGLNLKFRFDF